MRGVWLFGAPNIAAVVYISGGRRAQWCKIRNGN